MSASPPPEIMPTGLLEHLHGDVTNVLQFGNNSKNPDIALHSSWHNDLDRVTQPAVLRCKHRKADIHPTRLYDARERNAKSGLQPGHYMALSYCWDEWPEESIDALRDKLYEVSERLGVRYFWVDRWCIDQSDPGDKEREIPRMREYYTGARGCVVFTGPSAVPFKCVPKQEGAILSAFQQVQQNSEALKALLSCKWVHRVWTLQEALMSRQVVYAIQDQLLDGDYISELMSYVATFPEEYMNIGEGRRIWIGGYGCYRWDTRAPTVVFPRQFRMRKQSPTTLTIMRTVFGGEQQYRELQSMPGGLLMPLEEAIVMTIDRHATKNEDYIYGILGISDGGGKISIEYDIDWKSMIKKLRESDMVTERQLAAPTVNEESGWSWLPSCSANYGPFKNIERLSALISRPPLPKSGQSITVLGAVFEWSDLVFYERGFLNIHGQSCSLMHGTIRFPDSPGLIARVGATSCQTIRQERMEGTHVMLCTGVSRDTRDTVAMRVSGDVENRRVTRQDGYVLELHRWVSGDPRSLHGKEWTLGNG